MPSFAYSAINSQGIELTGEIQAADLAAARDTLRGNGLLAQRVARSREVGSLDLAGELDPLAVDGAIGEGRHLRLRYR